MFKRHASLCLLTAALMLPLGAMAVESNASAVASEIKEQAKTEAAETTKADRLHEMRMHAHKHIYGSELMTEDERNAFKAKVDAAKTEEDCIKICDEHRAAMQKRAKERGVELKDQPAQCPGHPKGKCQGKAEGKCPGKGKGHGHEMHHEKMLENMKEKAEKPL